MKLGGKNHLNFVFSRADHPKRKKKHPSVNGVIFFKIGVSVIDARVGEGLACSTGVEI